MLLFLCNGGGGGGWSVGAAFLHRTQYFFIFTGICFSAFVNFCLHFVKAQVPGFCLYKRSKITEKSCSFSNYNISLIFIFLSF